MAAMRLASQLGEQFDSAIRARTRDVDVVSIASGVPEALPMDIDAMIALPFLQSGQVAPTKPAGWPFGLKWIQLVSVGADLYPDWLFEGPVVSCARGATSDALAEFALAAIFAAAKNMPNIWIDAIDDWKHQGIGMVRGSTLGIVGFGGIGAALAPRALALGMSVIATRRTDALFGIDGVERAESLIDLFARSDHVVLAAPATAETRGMISAEVLSHAKQGLHLINLARGILIDDDALLAALDRRQLSLASLDVTHPEPLPADHPFYRHPQIRVSPHVAVMTNEVGGALLDKLTANLDRVARGQAPEDIVDLNRGY